MIKESFLKNECQIFLGVILKNQENWSDEKQCLNFSWKSSDFRWFSPKRKVNEKAKQWESILTSNASHEKVFRFSLTLFQGREKVAKNDVNEQWKTFFTSLKNTYRRVNARIKHCLSKLHINYIKILNLTFFAIHWL